MSKTCRVPSCEVLLFGSRDLCDGHFNRLPDKARETLDRLLEAKPGSADAVRYAAEIDAAAHVLGNMGPKIQRGLMGRGSGYPTGPGRIS